VRLALIVFFFTVGLARAQEGEASKPAAPASGMPVMVAQAVKACFSAAVRTTGFLVPRAEAVVVPVLDGFEIVEVLAAEGDTVAEKQPLARLERVGTEASSGAGASASSRGPASIVLRAPEAGKVVSATAIQGAPSAARGAPLFRLAIDGVIETDAEVSSIYLKDIKENQAARIEIDRGQAVSGRVRKIASQIDPVTQMGHVRIALDDDSSLRVGRFVRATIDARESCGLSVPRSAVLYGTEGTSVQVVRGNLIETVPVRVGLTSDRDAEIQTGLRPGELVIAHAGTSLRDGDRVAPVLIDESGATTGRR
jgi:multidrug efflux pump subunit AcrA (membrane-fusion protein)